MVKLYNFKTRGIGVITTTSIPQDFFIGLYLKQNIPSTPICRLIHDGWVETNPLGRYINHNRKPNCYVELFDGEVKLFAKEKIDEFTELTIDYFTVVDLIKIPETVLKKLEVTDYDYIDETIDKVINLI